VLGRKKGKVKKRKKLGKIERLMGYGEGYDAGHILEITI